MCLPQAARPTFKQTTTQTHRVLLFPGSDQRFKLTDDGELEVSACSKPCPKRYLYTSFGSEDMVQVTAVSAQALCTGNKEFQMVGYPY